MHHRARATEIVFQKQKKVSMRQGSNGRRARGRPHRRQGGGINKNSTFDSNGPEGRVRGNAHQVYEKYISLARDATSSGDRILAESYYQFAEHYFRIVNDSMDPQPGQRKRAEGEEGSYDGEDDGDQENEGDGSEQAAEGGQRPSRRERMNGRHRRQRYDNGEGREQPEQRDPGSEPQPSLDLSKSDQPEVVEQQAAETGEEAPKPRRRGRPRKEETAGQDDSGSDPAAA
jgi:hypothetical protein